MKKTKAVGEPKPTATKKDEYIKNLRYILSNDFNIRIYISQEQWKDFQSLMSQLKNDFEYIAYILHDKDNEEQHVHLILRSEKRKKASTIYNLFKEFRNENGEQQNTYIERPKSWKGSKEYLTHKNAQEKHQYKWEEVIEYGKDETENIYYTMVINHIKNKNPLEMLKKYGRNYLCNYKAIKDFIDDLHIWCSARNTTIEKLLENPANGLKEIKNEEMPF